MALEVISQDINPGNMGLNASHGKSVEYIFVFSLHLNCSRKLLYTFIISIQRAENTIKSKKFKSETVL